MTMRMTVAELAEKLEGTVDGDGSLEVSGLAGLKEAEKGEISFLANQRYGEAVATTGATAVIVNADWEGEGSCALIRVANADAAFAEAARLMSPPGEEPEPGVHPSAIVADDAELGEDVSVGPCCVVKPGVRIGRGTMLEAGCFVGRDTVIGESCRLCPHVSIRERTRIGDRARIHSGAVIGSDGFGYVREDDVWKKIPQIGHVEIGDDVEIGANVTVDRARFGKTVIGNGVKIDNLVQIAHNVRIGDNTAMAAQVGISGSTSVGSNVQIGGQAGLAGHIRIGDGAVLGGQAGVSKDVPPGGFLSSFVALPHRESRKAQAGLVRLPKLRKLVAAIEKRLARLGARAAGGEHTG